MAYGAERLSLRIGEDSGLEIILEEERLGEKGGNDYASNLLSITFVVHGIVALVCTFLAPQLIYTQSFLNA